MLKTMTIAAGVLALSGSVALVTEQHDAARSQCSARRCRRIGAHKHHRHAQRQCAGHGRRRHALDHCSVADQQESERCRNGAQRLQLGRAQMQYGTQT